MNGRDIDEASASGVYAALLGLRLLGLTNVQKGTIAGAHFDDHRLAQTRMRDFVEQHHPAIFRSSLPAPRTGYVDDLEAAQTAPGGDGKRAPAGFDGQDAPLRTGRIFESAEGEKKDGAEEKPRRIQPPKHAAIIRFVTRGEIEEQLIAIVRQEKNVADELLKPETSLAEAGIDSLDSLTILFGIEEQFRISIPDDEARAVRTFGDLADIIEKRTTSAER